MKQKAYRFDSGQEKQQLINHYGEKFFKHIPGIYDTSGYLYGDGDGWGWTSATREKFKTDAYYKTFEEVLIGHLGSSLESQIALAKTYIGKTVVKDTGVKYNIVNVRVVMSDSEPDLIIRVEELLRTNPWVVCVVSNMDTALPIIDNNFKVVPSSKTIKLTDDYDAIISKDEVKVGCQTIPVDKLKEILAIVEELNS